MYSRLYICLSLISILLPLDLEENSSYQNLYLMNFDNILENQSIQYLSEKFPQLIKDEYSNESYLNILDSPKILKSFRYNPDLENGLIINGKYFISNNLIVVSFDAYDVDTWDKQASRTYYCDNEDVECIEKAFIACVQEDVIPLFCTYYDCLGNCNGLAEFDCLGDCNGNAVEDCMGRCDGEAKIDCNGECDGKALLDNCGECDYNVYNDCEQDCNGDWGGSAIVNICGNCVLGNTSYDDISYGMDCLGNCDGTATVDCNGQCNGYAFINDCNVCVGGNTGNIITLGLDCSGRCFGDSFVDQCGVCNGNNTSCADCMGTPNGMAILDNCGNCDYTVKNDCLQDCNGDWGGTAFINDCFVCVGGKTGLSHDDGMDCEDVCWGNAKIDACGVCNGDNECDKKDYVVQYKENTQNVNNKKFFHQDSNSKVFFDSSSLNWSEGEQKNTMHIYNLVDNLKNELYLADIGDFNKSIVDGEVVLEIPIAYSINKNYMNMLRYGKDFSTNSSFIYRFSNSEVDISKNFEKYLSSMKYQLVPVLFFYSNSDEVLFILIDSWNKNYGSSLKNKFNIISENQFETLFSITPGDSFLQFNFDKKSLKTSYQLSLSKDEYSSLGYMIVKFFNENSLESDLYHHLTNN